MINSKCKGCTKRVVGCHSTCEDYKEFRKELDKQNEAERADREFSSYARTDRDERYIKFLKNRRK